MADQTPNFSAMTDEELDNFLKTPVAPPPRAAGVNPMTGQPFTSQEVSRAVFGGGVDPVEGGFLEGMGSQINKLVEGAKHGAQIMFAPKDPAAEKALFDRIKKEREETAAIDAQLMTNPSAVAGGFAGKVLPAIAAPARLPAQVALEAVTGAIEDVPGTPTGVSGELGARSLQAGERALVTGLVGKGTQALGKSIGAATGEFTEKGAKAMALRDAASDRLGIDMNIGELDPQSWMGIFARKSPGYQRHLEESAGKLSESMSAKRQVPSLTGRSTTERVAPGEELRQSVANAAAKIEEAGKQKWQSVDDFVMQNNVPQVIPSSFFPVVENIGKNFTTIKNVRGKPVYQGNEVFDRVADYNDQAANWLKLMAGTPTVQQGSIPFSAINDMRMAVGKALQRAERDMAAPNPTQTTREARNELKKLYATLNNDLEGWAKTNAKTGEAKALFDEANTFWRERLIPDVMQNRLARKSGAGEIGTKTRGYENAEQLYTDILGKGGQERVARLEETLNPKAKTQIDVLRSLESVAPVQTDAGLAALALIRTAQGYPISYGVGSALPRIPGTRWAAQSRPVQALHFAKNVLEGSPVGQVAPDILPRVAWGATQYPSESTLEGVRRLRGSQGR